MHTKYRLFIFLLTTLLLATRILIAQDECYIQQRVDYTIDIDLNDKENTFKGKEVISYANNFADTLHQLFIHLYWNAFQPESMMDVRSRELGKRHPFGRPDWDERVKDRIQKLSPREQGFSIIKKLSVNGEEQSVLIKETIAQVVLKTPIPPHSISRIEIDFDAQTPIQIRRSGRNNAEGVAYSMSQWYPKICVYDETGWTPNPYVAREFYGNWGDFDVNIQIDTIFFVAGSGLLSNKPRSFPLKKQKGKKIWRFIAPNAHDFVWAADRTYIEKTKRIQDDIEIAVVYKKGSDKQNERWENLLNVAEKAYPFIKKHFGPYPYKKYSFIQGGDGGMEYPNATLIRSASEGTALHEWMHTWYQMILATNESLYAWMDEGFTSWAENEIDIYLHPEKKEKRLSYYNGYFAAVSNGIEEAPIVHADHFETNAAYGISSYVKGAIFLEQLSYIVGRPTLDKILLDYYQKWKFKHPDPERFLRVAEKASGLQLNWYKEYWINGIKTINYKIDSVAIVNKKSRIYLKNIGEMPMPIDIEVTFEDESKALYNIPLYLMFGHKKTDIYDNIIFLPEWKWTHPNYVFSVDKVVKKVEIDPSGRMADIDRRDNRYLVP